MVFTTLSGLDTSEDTRPKLVPKDLDNLLPHFADENFEKAPEGQGSGGLTRTKCALKFYVPEVKGEHTITKMSLKAGEEVFPLHHTQFLPRRQYIQSHMTSLVLTTMM